MNTNVKTWLLRSALVVAIGTLAVFAWQKYRSSGADAGLVSGNGRIEAVEIDIAAKTPGRIKDVLTREGDFVKAGQVVAVMDTESLDAQLRQAEAQAQQAQSSIAIASSQLNQRRAEKTATLAVLAQREAELGVANKRHDRSSTLAKEGASSQQEADDDSARVQSANAAVGAARAQVVAAEAAITTAEAQLAGAQSSVEAAKAAIARIRADIDDSTLKVPRDGRVQYLVAQPGEVIGAGGRVLNMIDLSDVYMTFFLPSAIAGQVALGSEARIVLDAAPNMPIPATISFVASTAQFTPKTVETTSERQKLMFRVKAQIAPELLRDNLEQVKTGLPGVAWVRLDGQASWPAELTSRLAE